MAKSMNGQLKMFDPTTYEDSSSVTSSPASGDGPTRSGSPDGPMIDTSGPAVARVSRGVRRGAGLAPTIRATFGRRGSSSSRSASLQVSLESKLKVLMDERGSTEFTFSWRKQDTPSGRQISRLVASARLTSAEGFGLWPTPSLDDAAGRQLGNPILTRNHTWRHRNRAGGQSRTRIAEVCNHLGRADLAGSGRFRGWLMGFPPAWKNATPTAMPSSRKSRKSSSKRI